MTVRDLYPDTYPNLLLDFANVKALDPRVTFARASSAVYYDGTTAAKAEENLLLQSQFASGWSIVGTNTITPNNSAAPDGTTTAALVSSPATTDYVYQFATTVVGLTYVFSFFVKNSTATASHYHVRTSNTAAFGTLTWSGSTLAAITATVGTASFVDVGNGWYRVSAIYTASETAVRHRIGAGDNTSTTGNIFVWGAQLEQRAALSSYTPTTTQPITRYQPVLLTTSNNAPRFDHNPVTEESLGFLIEEQRTNLATRSEEIGTSPWGFARASAQSNVHVAPDGTLTANKLVDNTETGSHDVSQNYTVTSGQYYTFSVYVKPSVDNEETP